MTNKETLLDWAQRFEAIAERLRTEANQKETLEKVRQAHEKLMGALTGLGEAKSTDERLQHIETLFGKPIEDVVTDENMKRIGKFLVFLEKLARVPKQTHMDQFIDLYVKATLDEMRSLGTIDEKTLDKQRRENLKRIRDVFENATKPLAESENHLSAALSALSRFNDPDFSEKIEPLFEYIKKCILEKKDELEKRMNNDGIAHVISFSKEYLDTKGKTRGPDYPYIAALPRLLLSLGATEKESWEMLDPKTTEIEGLSWNLWHRYWQRAKARLKGV